MKSITDYDSANIFHKKFQGGVRQGVPVPPPVQGGMIKVLTVLHYEHGITKPDYEVVRDWSTFKADQAKEMAALGLS